jgi:hypothetical protein
MGHIDNRFDDLDLPETSPVAPVQLGRGLPIPPILPVVALLCLVTGLALGLGLGSKPASVAVSTPTPGSTIPAITDPPVESYDPSQLPIVILPEIAMPTELPPGNGLSLSEALTALAKNGPKDAMVTVTASNVVSARVVRDRQVSSSYANPTDEWVWEFIVTGDVGSTAPCPSEFGDPAAPVLCGVSSATEVILLDYFTGTLVESYAIVESYFPAP